MKSNLIFRLLAAALVEHAFAVQALRPTLFIGVPRVFDKLYDGVYAKLALARPTQRWLFHLAFWWKQRQIRAGYKWDKVSFSSRRIHGCLAV